MQERNVAPCRIDGGKYWCTECCEGRNCCDLGNLPDGSWGCLGWNLKRVRTVNTVDGPIEAMPQPDFCKDVNCVELMGLNASEVMNQIRKGPPGEFFMSIVADEINNKNHGQ